MKKGLTVFARESTPIPESEKMLLFFGSQDLSPGQTYFYTPCNFYAAWNTEAQTKTPLAQGFTVSRLVCNIVDAPGAGEFVTFQLRKNGISVSSICEYDDTQNGVQDIVLLPTTFNPLDTIDLIAQTSSGCLTQLFMLSVKATLI